MDSFERATVALRAGARDQVTRAETTAEVTFGVLLEDFLTISAARGRSPRRCTATPP